MRRTFTPEEDIQILEFAEEHKNDITIPWVELANTTMKNHSNAMIGQRYHQLKKKGVTLESLKPKPHPRKSPVVTTGGKRSPLEQMRKQKNNHAYTYEEECELMKLYKIYGKNYDEIVKHFSVKDVTCSAIKLKIRRLLNRRFVLKDEAPKVTYRVRDLHPPRYKPLPRSISLEVIPLPIPIPDPFKFPDQNYPKKQDDDFFKGFSPSSYCEDIFDDNFLDYI